MCNHSGGKEHSCNPQKFDEQVVLESKIVIMLDAYGIFINGNSITISQYKYPLLMVLELIRS